MIYVDNREGSKDLIGPLCALNIPCELDRLDFADVMWFGKGPRGGYVPVGIEVKTIPDLLQCIHSGRFSGHQLPGLLRDYQSHAWLLVEGMWRPSKEGLLETFRGGRWQDGALGGRQWMYREVDNWLTSMQEMTGIHLRQTAGRSETARTIADMHQWWGKEWKDHKSHLAIHLPAPNTMQLREPSLLVKVASLLPGLGWQRAQICGRAFSSIREMINADEATWKNLPGIGKTLAKRIREAVEGR